MLNIQIPKLDKNAVQLIFFDVADFTEQADTLYPLLSEIEQQKVNKFLFNKDKIQYILARGFLRKLLGIYLNISNEKIHFIINQYGKPFLDNDHALQFNLSHSKTKIIYAFTRQAMVGVDIETIDKAIDFDAIAKRFFHEHEAQLIHSLPEKTKKEAFFKIWVMKEAFIKATGEGLSQNMENIEIVLKTEQLLPTVILHDTRYESLDWQLNLVHIAADYATAVAVKGNLNQLIINPLSDFIIT